MEYFETQYPGVRVRGAGYRYEGKRREAHLIATVTDPAASVSLQLSRLWDAAAQMTRVLGLKPAFCRWLLSDPANQFAVLSELLGVRYPGDGGECAWSVVGQPPLDGSRGALFMILEEDPTFQQTAPGIWTDELGRIWASDIDSAKGIDSETLTVSYLEKMSAVCRDLGGSLSESCLRTWFFVRDIDNNYGGVVRGRNRVFDAEGLTSDTHFIASTGIGGEGARPHTLVSFNAFADTRLHPSQVRYLHAPTHLNRTSEYGVAFERATAVDYPDKRHIYISGTASIDNHGAIVAPGEVKAQTERMLENIEVLLKEGGGCWNDVAHMIVYLRDAADYPVVGQMMKNRFPHTPMVIVQAPVCRPAWLVETECMAICRRNETCKEE